MAIVCDTAPLAAAHALERAWSGNAQLARPESDLAAFRRPQPALKSFVTHPPLAQGTSGAGAPGVAV